MFKVGTLTFELPRVLTSRSSMEDQTIATLVHPVERCLTNNDIEGALKGLRELALTYIRIGSGCTLVASDDYRILQTTIGLSPDIPPGHYALDINNRCVINNDQGLSLDWDSDHDPIQIYEHPGVDAQTGEEVTFALCVKFPCTKLPPAFRRMELPKLRFSGVSMTPPQPVSQVDWDASMTKTMSDQPIGLVTMRWWAFILHEACAHHNGNTTRIDYIVDSLSKLQ